MDLRPPHRSVVGVVGVVGDELRSSTVALLQGYDAAVGVDETQLTPQQRLHPKRSGEDETTGGTRISSALPLMPCKIQDM